MADCGDRNSYVSLRALGSHGKHRHPLAGARVQMNRSADALPPHACATQRYSTTSPRAVAAYRSVQLGMLTH